MLTATDLQRLLEVFPDVEVTEDKGRRTTFLNTRQELHRLLHVRPFRFRMEIQHLTDNIEDMLTALLRRDILLNTVREEHDADFIVVLNGRESNSCSNLRHHITLHLMLGTEVQ